MIVMNNLLRKIKLLIVLLDNYKDFFIKGKNALNKPYKWTNKIKKARLLIQYELAQGRI